MYTSISGQQIADQIYGTVAAKMQRDYGDTIKVEPTTTTKVNVGEMHGLTFREEGSSVSAVIYTDKLVDQVADGSLSIDDAASKVIGDWYLQRTNEATIKAPNLSDLGATKQALYCIVINKKLNQDLLAQGVPHRDIPGTDLTLVMRYRVADDKDGRASFLVLDEHLGRLGLTESEAFEIAIPNTMRDTYTIKSMTDVMRDMGVPEEMLDGMGAGPQMYVIGNSSKINGATGVFADRGLRAEMRDTLIANGESGEFFIIPSSIHETLVVSADDADSQALADMIKEVNETQLAPDEVLGEQPYFCNSELQLRMPGQDFADDMAETATESIGAHL